MKIPLLIILSLLNHTANSLSFNFTNFATSGGRLNYTGDASSLNGTVHLTGNHTLSAGRVTYFEPLLLWDSSSENANYLSSFSTSFSFTIQCYNVTACSDGMAFFLAPADIPTKTHGYGGFGLPEDIPTSTNYPFVAVEIDTYANIYDPQLIPNSSYAHIGIDVDSFISNVTQPWSDSRVRKGILTFANVSYESSTRNLSVSVSRDDGDVRISLVIDLRKYLPKNVAVGISAATGDFLETHTVSSWEFNSSLEAVVDNRTNSTSGGGKMSRGRIVGISVGTATGACALVLVLVIGVCSFIKWGKRKEENKEDEAFENGAAGPRRFLYGELASAAGNFSDEAKLGQGGFGAVYKGYLKASDMVVAIKKISRESLQGMKEYASEISTISKLRHRNLVQLMGWCHKKEDFLLVYEYMPNGSLDQHLHKEKSLLPWDVRFKIARGLASSILYLHEEYEQCVVHRDIKSSNVMPDSNFNAKLGDFGLARLVDHDKGWQTTNIAGTLGYLAPDYARTGHASRESDVYAFGIVALEIASGQKPVTSRDATNESPSHIVTWVSDLYGSGRLLAAIDPRLNGEFDRQQAECLMVVGLWCAQPDSKLRPSIRQVIRILDFETQLPVLRLELPELGFDAPPGQRAGGSDYCSGASLTASSLDEPR